MQLLDPARFRGELDGQPVALYVLRNSQGMVAAITNYGAKIEQLLVPDSQGRLADVVLGYDCLDSAIAGAPSMGAFIGRYAGRIGHARFTLDGEQFLLNANAGKHCLHGGVRGSRFRVFDAVQRDAASVEMRYVFADGEQGFPGTLALRLSYSLTDANELRLDYEAVALDKASVASFTTHAFFNLNGEASGNAMGHEVTIHADQRLATDVDLIATGELLPVAGTVFDFREAALLRERVGASPENGKVEGYDCCYVIKPGDAGQLALCATVRAPESGRVMQVWSTEPSLQFYTGLLPQQALAGGAGKSGQTYFQQQGLCLEPQGYPNAPNCPAFPSAVYAPGKSRSATTIYRFGTHPVREYSGGVGE
ncbi:aldose epimerase family protein [Polaromonas sp.]|uniref:aldose epimerase family protein n=1 Tax=Polaromonas sp. TaxID=1869339 RepID=UPI00286A26AB|nr:aldose epimerase family protein [Polaromonas sp.]